MKMPPHMHELFEQYFDGQATPEVCQAIEEWLWQDPRNPRLLAEYGFIERMLYNEQKSLDSVAIHTLAAEFETSGIPDLLTYVPPEASDTDSGKQITASELLRLSGYLLGKALKSRPAYRVYAAAAIVLVICIAALVLSPADDTPQVVDSRPAPVVEPDRVAPSPEPDPVFAPVVATLTGQRGAQWQVHSGTTAPNIGTELTANQALTLTAGVAEITTLRGAVAIIQGPATIELIEHDNALRLTAGKLVGICETKSSQGFVVHTPDLDATDFGTRFGVSVQPGVGSEVHVHQGEVEVAPASAAQVKRVTGNNAVRVERGAEAAVAIAPSFRQFNQALVTHRLPGTGFDMAEGTFDPSWNIVADAKGPLASPVPLRVQPRDHPHWPAKENDATRAQWLFFSIDVASTSPLVTAPLELDTSKLVFENRFELADTPKPDGMELYMHLRVRKGLVEAIRINGQPLDPSQVKTQTSVGAEREIVIPVSESHLKAGDNVIQIDFNNNYEPRIAMLYLFWELRAAEPDSSTTGESSP